MGGFTHQPSGPARIDWSNPLSAGLQSASYATESLRFRNFVTGQSFDDPYSDHSFRIREYSKHGISRTTPGGSYRQWHTLTPSTTRGKATLLVLVRPRFASTGTSSIADCGEALGGWSMAVFQYAAGGKFLAKCINGSSLLSDTAYEVGELHTLAFTNNGSAARQRFYVNGALQAATGAYGGNSAKKLDTIGVGNTNANLTDYFAIFAWDRELTAHEIREISANPYQLFVASEDYYDLAPVSAFPGDDKPLAASASSASTASAALTTSKPLGASAASASFFSAVLATGKPLAASAVSASYFSAVLATGMPFAAAAYSSSSATANLWTAALQDLVASAYSSSTASADLTTGVSLGGAANAAGYASGALTTSISLGAAANATGYASGTLATSISLGGAAYSSSTASAELLAVVLQSFSPSAARTLRILPAPGAFNGADYWDWEVPSRPAALKRADQALDYSVDWTPWLAEVAGNVASYEFIAPADLSILAHKRSGALCSVFASGGNPGLRPVTCRITTDTVPPLVEDRTIYLLVTN